MTKITPTKGQKAAPQRKSTTGAKKKEKPKDTLKHNTIFNGSMTLVGVELTLTRTDWRELEDEGFKVIYKRVEDLYNKTLEGNINAD